MINYAIEYVPRILITIEQQKRRVLFKVRYDDIRLTPFSEIAIIIR